MDRSDLDLTQRLLMDRGLVIEEATYKCEVFGSWPPPRAGGGGIPGRELSREGRTVSYPAVPLARARRGVEGVVFATTYLQGTRVPTKPAQSLVTGAPSLRSIDVCIEQLPDHALVPVFD
jgi:hypothetical protein